MAFVKPNMSKKVDLSIQGLKTGILESFSKKIYKKALKMAYLYVLKVDRSATPEEQTEAWSEIVGCLKKDDIVKQVIKVCKELLGMTSTNGPERAIITKQLVGIMGVVSFWFTKPELQAEIEVFWDTFLNAMTSYLVSDFGPIGDSIVYLNKSNKMPNVVKSLVYSVMKLVSQKDLMNTLEQRQDLLTLSKKSLLACPHSQNIRLLYNDVLLYTGNYNGLLLAANEDGKKVPAQFPPDFRLMEVFRSDGKATHTFGEKTSALKIGLLQFPNNKFFQKTVRTINELQKAGPSTKPPISSEEAFKLCQTEKDKILVTVFGFKSDGSFG